MDSSIATTLITNAGIAGVVIVLILLGILVPKWYVSKLEKEITLKDQALKTEREISKQATEQLAIANQLVGELRAIAAQRAQTEQMRPRALEPPYDMGEGYVRTPTDPRGSGS